MRHLHPVQLRIVVRLSKTGKHEEVRILKERTAAESGWSEHRGVQGSGRLVYVCMRMWRLLVMLRWWRG